MADGEDVLLAGKQLSKCLDMRGVEGHLFDEMSRLSLTRVALNLAIVACARLLGGGKWNTIQRHVAIDEQKCTKERGYLLERFNLGVDGECVLQQRRARPRKAEHHV